MLLKQTKGGRALAKDSAVKLTVLEFMHTHATLHSSMDYDPSRKSFSIQPCEDSTPGVYFIVNGHDILKIGKAEGRHGLKGRINSYRSNLSTRKNDHTVDRIFSAMTGKLHGAILQMYILPLPKEKAVFKGYEIELQMARSLEEALSKQARLERHSMLLSGQD